VKKRIGIAALLVAGIYALALGLGSTLYATGAIATGATHNDCADFRHVIAVERGIDAHDVPQSEISARTQACLDGHALTKGEAFRSEYLFWAAWPGVICAIIFLAWPAWARALRNQDLSDAVREAGHLEPGA
jgi:hypothetical protein